MKKLSIIVLLLTFSYANAQDLFIGIKGGVNNNIIGDFYHYGEETGIGGDLNPDLSKLYKANEGVGNHYGIYFKVDFGRLFVKPEINYVSEKNSYALALNTTNWTSTKIEVPFLIGIHVYKPISIYAGPVFSSISDVKLEGLKQLNGTAETPIKFDSNSTGLSAGLLFEYNRFGIDLRYEYGITPVNKQTIKLIRTAYGTYVADLNKYNPSQISVSFTISLFHFSLDKTSRARNRYDWHNPKNL